MSRSRKPTTQDKLTSAVGIMYAEVRCLTVVSPAKRQAQYDTEDCLQTLLRSNLLLGRIAEKMDEM